MPKEQGRKVIAQNRKARHDYHVEDTWEAGLVLMGTEVKSLRQGRATLVDGFAEVDDHEVWLHGVHIPEYTQGTWTNHASRRRRKLLLNKAEIAKIERKIGDKGYTLVPLQLYFKDGRAKVEIGLAQGQEVLRQAPCPRRAPGRAREAAGDRAPGQGPHRLMPRTIDPVAFARELGLPGLFDVHTHFLPPRVMAKVREQFDTAGPLIGRPWPLHYRGSDDELVATLRGFGVRRFSALAYAHRPGMAEFLNDWSAGFAARVPDCLHSATFYPEDGAGAYVAARLAGGAEIFKVHVQVGAIDVRDPLLTEVWGLLEDAGTPVVLHAGSGPVGTPYTGPGPVGELLARFPRLALVIAHLGAPEYADFLSLAERYDRVCVDTTMVFTPFFDDLGAAFPADLLPRLRDLQPKVLLGSDFPNIPYSYDTQLIGLTRLGLGNDWLRSVCWENGVRIFGAAAVRDG